MDNRTSSEILKPHVTQPASAPNPVTDGRVHQNQPERTENQHRRETHPLSKTTDDQGRGNHGEGQLKHHKQRLGDGATHAVHRHFREKQIPQIADPLALFNPR